tara:strand:+ start:172 stop:540 length:369 start_codon:yes stop_codon:yes gene_type:complete
VIQELIIRFDYHSAKTVKKLRGLELEKKNTTDNEKISQLKNDINKLQREYEEKLKPIALEIAFNIEAKMEKMSNDEMIEQFNVQNVNSAMIGECVYKICQKLERQPTRNVILEMMPEKFRSN